MLEKEINKLNLFSGNLPEIVTAIADSIPSRTIPYRMKLAFAVSEIMLFASQFRFNIKHWNDSIIPINSIMFCIAKSGASKDSSIKAARKCFEESYKIINQKRHDNAVATAINKAADAGYDLPEKFASYKDFFISPNPLFVAISTTEGFIQHLNDLSNDVLGAGYIYSGEVGAELASNSNLTENIKILSELYDEGTKEVKILKARENQSKEVKHLPVSALFIGSQDNILYEDIIKRKFKTEFTSKLARRSFFIFVNEDIIQNNFSTVEALLKEDYIAETKAKQSREEVSDYVTDLTNQYIDKSELLLIPSDEVRNLFVLYKRYNEELANTIDSQFPMTKLTRSHLQWKALKLSGALALLSGSATIELEHYRGAIEFLELTNRDINEFEKELVKEPYELFADYCRLYCHDGEYAITLHSLRKAGFIPMKGQSNTSLTELVKLVNSYDSNAAYTLKNDIVYFKELDRTDKILLSYVPYTGTDKHKMAAQCTSGYVCEELTFKDLEKMLEGNYGYTSFRFTNGVRGKDNVESPCKWIILDIDSSEITDTEAHILLSDINHYVVRTSNPNNEHKFRVLIELDAEIDIPDMQWKPFIKSIVTDLGLTTDPLPKSQIYFSYANRTILSQLEAQPLAVKPYIELLNSKQVEEKKPISKKAANQMLTNKFTTFDKAFNATFGEGGRKLIWAARYARELGADKEYTIELLKEINSFWMAPYPEPDFTKCIINQVERWSF
jgi:hypothetical protein